MYTNVINYVDPVNRLTGFRKTVLQSLTIPLAYSTKYHSHNFNLLFTLSNLSLLSARSTYKKFAYTICITSANHAHRTGSRRVYGELGFLVGPHIHQSPRPTGIDTTHTSTHSSRSACYVNASRCAGA